MVFVTQDVGQNCVILAFKNKAHCDTRDRALDWDARVHHRKASAANGRHRRRTIGLGNVAGDADCVRKLILGWQHGMQRAPCKLTMADVTAAWRAEASHFTNAVGWEVVMQHEVFIMQATKTIDHLLCLLGTQGAGRDGLRFTTCEQRRTV